MISSAKRMTGLAILSLAIVAGTCGVHDMTVHQDRQFVTRAAVLGIETYRKHLSAPASHVVQCRFKPTCSSYGLAAVHEYGGYKGSWMAFKRVARCNPWTAQGTVDEP